MVASATNRPRTKNVAVAAARYDAATLRAEEEARDQAQQIRVTELRLRFVDGPVLTMPAGGSGTSDTTGPSAFRDRCRVLSQFHPFRSMRPSQRQQRRLALCRWDYTVCTGYRAARRDHPPGGRLERHSELRVDGAAGGATWLLCCRSQKLIRAAHDGGTCRIKQLQRTVERPRERGARPLNCGVRWLRVYESKV
jgi:hypothetical protein